ncbi:pentatricopeptide repeat-containing protein At2g16880-like isoform X2 [Durio zibethinus]|uniref:Pentatricopeptide repeat-containing protein At2g16880-like isoform X2 n=1 Tax=Durio zibethinus TaxID=66656 RepID=A0A6P5ZB68_DURZI|nr:pentatricopeptide repeat-containing protein At2g16880-like isoform X2 [Durio zibethinus]
MALPSSRTISISSQALADITPLVNSVTSLLQTLNPQTPNAKNLSSAPLNRFSPFLDPKFVTQVINKQTNPYHALFFFNWASKPNPNPKNYTHNNKCYEAITNLLLYHSLFSPAIQLLKESQKLSDFFIGKIIKAYGEKVLGVLVKDNKINLVKTLFDNVVKKGFVQPDVSSYTTLIRGLCKVGMVESAKKVFDEMSCKPNLLTFNTMINGFCKKGDLESATLLFYKMMAEMDCLPDTVTYTTLIDGYCKKGKFEEAMKYMDKMVKGGCFPSVLTYNAIIYSLCLRGEVDEAKKMMSKMRLNGVKDNTATHLSILKGLSVAGRSKEAIEYFRWMVSCIMDLDVKAYIVVVNEYCKLRKLDEAILLPKGMRGRGINPNVSSFNSVFRVLVELRELDRAVLLLKQMPQIGSSPNFLSYRTVICSLCRAEGRMRGVEYLVNNMLRNGILIDATMYGCILEGYSRDGNEEMAVQVFNEMIGNSYVISLESFSIFVKMLCGRGMTVKAEKFFEDICRTCPVVERGSYRRVLDEHLEITQGSSKEHGGGESS